MTAWIYVTRTAEGRLVDDDGDFYCNETFGTDADAEKYLEQNDLRASLR